MSRSPAAILLGPQDPVPTVRDEVRRLKASGVATISAGWQEREKEDQELDEALGGNTWNMELYARAEDVAERDSELAEAHHHLQGQIKLLRRVYNHRLAAAMTAWMDIESFTGDARVLAEEARAALEAVRQLDQHHLRRAAELRQEFADRWKPWRRAAVKEHRRELAKALRDFDVVAIAGGHVAVLLNRMRLFGVDEWLRDRIVLAWSAGAMALSSRVVLFHDSPPQGPGHAEVLEAGLGLYADCIVFPHGSRRLGVEDRPRMSRLARRLAPAHCLLLDPGAQVTRERGKWSSRGGISRVLDDGQLEIVHRWSGS